MTEEEDLSRVKKLVSDYLTVLDAYILRDSPEWITAVVTVETPNGSRSLRFYRWRNDGGEWKKDSGFNVNRKGDWEEIREIGDELAQELWEGEEG